jgi:hypothetical protein
MRDIDIYSQSRLFRPSFSDMYRFNTDELKDIAANNHITVSGNKGEIIHQILDKCKDLRCSIAVAE